MKRKVAVNTAYNQPAFLSYVREKRVKAITGKRYLSWILVKNMKKAKYKILVKYIISGLLGLEGESVSI